jgi:hypothetical protein
METDYRRICIMRLDGFGLLVEDMGNLIEIGSWNKSFEEKDAGR